MDVNQVLAGTLSAGMLLEVLIGISREEVGPELTDVDRYSDSFRR